jgi:hypothetical protein
MRLYADKFPATSKLPRDLYQHYVYIDGAFVRERERGREGGQDYP